MTKNSPMMDWVVKSWSGIAVSSTFMSLISMTSVPSLSLGNSCAFAKRLFAIFCSSVVNAINSFCLGGMFSSLMWTVVSGVTSRVRGGCAPWLRRSLFALMASFMNALGFFETAFHEVISVVICSEMGTLVTLCWRDLVFFSSWDMRMAV